MEMKWVTAEKLWLKAKMEHLLDQKEKVAPSGGRLAQLRGWPPGWLSWTSELMVIKCHFCLLIDLIRAS